ncbi:hypothetical protein HAX54_051780 [Datura stramonium]|uniref:Reticulon domain-containing protein n=1 Tax=Datura stramonium TaxID=4076 RepID=A0ABS8WQT3_DATST|nr:hypothetical protein [Datura stramonium]
MGSKTNLGVGGSVTSVMSGKRKTWKSDSSNLEGNPIQISRKRSEFGKNLDEQCKELTTAGAMKKSPVQSKKCGTEKSPVKIMKAKSGLLLLSDGNEKGNGIQLRKVKSEASKEGNVSPNGNLRNSLQLVKAKSENFKNSDVIEANKVIVVADVLDESKKNLEGVLFGESSDGNEKGNGIQLREVKSEANNGNLRDSVQLVKAKSENFKNSDVSEANKVVVVDDVLDESSKGNKAENEKKGNESFEENKVVVVGENCEEKVITSNVEPQQEKLNLENEEDVDEGIEKEINLAEEIIKTKQIVIVEENKVHVSNNEQKQVPISPIIKKQSPPISGQSRIHHHHPSPSRTKPVPTSDESQRNIPRQHSKLESFVDLVMWRDASKSTLIFGIGTFFIISSSYTQDLNIRALFSGDPATTMKMAIVLFILARCGSSITIWKMTKLGFFGVFIVPKVCSSYSTQLTAYGTFWIRRFRDAWGTCTHKKAVAFAIFTLIWNLSSISARIWAVFMLYAGFRYYQRKMMKEGWVGEEEITKSEDYWQGKIGGQRAIGRKSTLMESKKQKKIL